MRVIKVKNKVTNVSADKNMRGKEFFIQYFKEEWQTGTEISEGKLNIIRVYPQKGELGG